LIALEQQQLTEIREHGERDYPYECCGLLIGRLEQGGRKVVLETYPISNAREEQAKRNRFLIRPEELLRGERYAVGKDLDVLGFYHSHPDDQAVPSQYDLEHAWPTYSYIVVSVQKGHAQDVRSWEMHASRSRFIEEQIFVGQTPKLVVPAIRNFVESNDSLNEGPDQAG
jgi:proteasome lid subunit RPN8/RPN11